MPLSPEKHTVKWSISHLQGTTYVSPILIHLENFQIITKIAYRNVFERFENSTWALMRGSMSSIPRADFASSPSEIYSAVANVTPASLIGSFALDSIDLAAVYTFRSTHNQPRSDDGVREKLVENPEESNECS